MKIDTLKQMREKAKTKKDGVYQFKGNAYLVYKNNVAAYYDNDYSQIMECAYGFSVVKGGDKRLYRYEAVPILRGYLKQYKLNY